jgi:hypothetical protein
LIGTVLEPVAASGYRDDFGVVQESVEDGAGRRHVAKELSPFFYFDLRWYTLSDRRQNRDHQAYEI